MKTLREFISEHSGMMIKFVAYQIAMSFFGMMMFMSIYAINEAYLKAAGIFCIAFYASILGTSLWEEGQKDRIRVSGGRLKKDVFTGIKICLVPYSVTILMSIVYAVCGFAAPESTVYAFLNIALKFVLSGIYVCFDTGFFDVSAPDGIFFLGYTLITLIIAFVSYYFGIEGYFEKGSKNSKN